MLELLQNYFITEILIFLVMFALAFKGVVTFWDWLSGKLKIWFGKDSKEEATHNEIRDSIKEVTKEICRLADRQDNAIDKLNNIENQVKLLTDADQADIKAWITEKHHYFCYEKKWIDDYNLDCIEKRYHYYTLEGGNSFIADLMKDIRKLPRVSNDGIDKK